MTWIVRGLNIRDSCLTTYPWHTKQFGDFVEDWRRSEQATWLVNSTDCFTFIIEHINLQNGLSANTLLSSPVPMTTYL